MRAVAAALSLVVCIEHRDARRQADAAAVEASVAGTAAHEGADGIDALAEDASNDGGTSGLPDAGADVIMAAVPFREAQGCTRDDYQDHTAPGARRQIAFTHGLGQDPDRCMRVSAGQSVTFAGDFSYHPLQPADDQPDSPIAAHRNGVVELPTTGIFGFVCGSHPGMRGALWVVP